MSGGGALSIGPTSEPVSKSLGNDASRVPPASRRASRKWAAALSILAALLALGAIVWYVVIPSPGSLRDRDPGRTAVMEQRVREARAAGGSLDIRQSWLPLDETSPNLVRAVIVGEDYRFRLHHGVDWVSLADEVHWTGGDGFSWLSPSDWGALARAVAYVWTDRSHIRGRSTITQQLAKNLYFSTDRSLLRKAMEFVVAGRLERELGKDRILELYLNVAEWGPGVFGAEAASRTYFGHSASTLTLDEAATLAATLPQPLTSNAVHRPGRMLWRKDLILERLRPPPDVPLEPMPLPDPEIELDTDVPAPEAVPLAPPTTLPSVPGAGADVLTPGPEPRL